MSSIKMLKSVGLKLSPNIFSPEVLKIYQLIFRKAKEIYFIEKFPII